MARSKMERKAMERLLVAREDDVRPLGKAILDEDDSDEARRTLMKKIRKREAARRAAEKKREHVRELEGTVRALMGQREQLVEQLTILRQGFVSVLDVLPDHLKNGVRSILAMQDTMEKDVSGELAWLHASMDRCPKETNADRPLA